MADLRVSVRRTPSRRCDEDRWEGFRVKGPRHDHWPRWVTHARVENDGAAINAMHAFIKSVNAQRGTHLRDEQADSLVSSAERIIQRSVVSRVN